MFVKLNNRVVDTKRIVSMYQGSDKGVIVYDRGSVVVPMIIEYNISFADYDKLSKLLAGSGEV